MASVQTSQTVASMLEEELSVLIGDYSIPHITEMSPDSILTKSQFAKVIFHDIADTYLTDADICCRYSLTDGVTPQHGDRIALYRLGWTSVQDYILFQWAPGPPVADKTELQVLFKASSLPKDVQEFYQLCYVTADNTVCGASVPFQFRHPYENELCAVEEPGGLLVVRSRTAVTEEKLRKTASANEQLKREKNDLEKNVKELEKECKKVSTELQDALSNLNKLETEKEVLEKRLDDNKHVERHVERLQQDLLALDLEKNNSLANLNKAQQHIAVLTATVDTLNADKEHMTQLLRSEAQNKCGAVAEVSQYKSQVDSLSHMLEALTQSKELVAQELRIQQATNSQLKDDIQRLEIQTREQQNKIKELENEKKVLQELLEQALASEKSVEAKNREIQELEKAKEDLLSQLVQSASRQEEEVKQRTMMYEEHLKGATNKIDILEQQLSECKVKVEEKEKDLKETEQMNKCLVQQLKDCEKIIENKENMLTQMEERKVTLESEFAKAVEAHQKTLEHNARLSRHLAELESETTPLRLQLEESRISQERRQHFKEVFTDIEHKIATLELEQEEIVYKKRIQTERVELISSRLSELEVETGKLQCERQDVASIRDTQEDELARSEEKLRVESQTESGLWGFPDIDALKETVNELNLFVESSKMRISEIDQRLTEIEDEKSVLILQQSQALERKDSWERRQADVGKELEALQEREREIVKEQGGQLATLQNQLDQALHQNSEMLASGLSKEEELALARKEMAELEQKLHGNRSNQDQECSSLSSTEVNSCLEQEQELKLRLQLAAEEYKKLYTEKQKVEKRLAKLCQKLGEKKLRSASSAQKSDSGREQPVTAELISISQTSATSTENSVSPSQSTAVPTANSVCPICAVRFPPGASDLFRQHFESHLS